MWVGDKTDVLKHEKWLFLGDNLLYLLFYSLYFSACLMFSAMKNNLFSKWSKIFPVLVAKRSSLLLIIGISNLNRNVPRVGKAKLVQP